MQRIIKGTIGVLLYFLLIMPGGCYVIAVVVENIGLRFDQPAADGWTVLVGLLWLVWIIYTAPRICVWLINIPSRRRAKRDAAKARKQAEQAEAEQNRRTGEGPVGDPLPAPNEPPPPFAPPLPPTTAPSA